jgi:hypothetical protein
MNLLAKLNAKLFNYYKILFCTLLIPYCKNYRIRINIFSSLFDVLNKHLIAAKQRVICFYIIAYIAERNL